MSAEFNLLKLKNINLKGVDIEPSYISGITIFESLSEPGITGYISIQDYQGFREVSNIFIGDEIILNFGVRDLDNETLSLKFVIYSDAGSLVLPLNTYDVLHLGFCSAWLLDGLLSLVSKPYKNKYIHEIIRDILTIECSGAKIGYIEPTNQKLEHLLLPKWSPYQTINYLLSFALNQDKVGGYILWTNIENDTINVTTLDYLIKGGGNGIGGQASRDLYILPPNQFYLGKVESLKLAESFDVFRMVNSGTNNTILYTYNPDNDGFLNTKYSITDIKNTHLSKFFPLSKRFLDKKYARIKFNSLFPSTKDPITDISKITDLADGLILSKYSLLSAGVLKLAITTLGDPKRRVGQTVLLHYPSQSHNSDSNENNVQLKQNYLISEIRHDLRYDAKGPDYKQYIVLMNDGYQTHNNNETVKW